VLCVARTKLLSPAANRGSATLHYINRPSALHTRSQVTLWPFWHHTITSESHIYCKGGKERRRPRYNSQFPVSFLEFMLLTHELQLETQFAFPPIRNHLHDARAPVPARDKIRVHCKSAFFISARCTSRFPPLRVPSNSRFPPNPTRCQRNSPTSRNNSKSSSQSA
jgi:hypothetical protein